MKEQNYAVPLAEDGYQPILKYAICFFKKRVHGQKGRMLEVG